jgi:hypothetical protein
VVCVAAMLADVQAGENPAGGACPVTTVVISGDGKGDRPVGSPEVKVSVGLARRGAPARELKGHWESTRESLVRSDREASKSTGRSEERTESASKANASREADGGDVESAEPIANGRRPSRRRRNWANAVDELSGVHEDGMPRMNGQRKHGTSRRLLRRKRTAKASRISRKGEIVMCRRVGQMGPNK